MASGKNNVQVTGDFILRAQMDIGNAEKQAQRIQEVLNSTEFKPQISKTFFTGLDKIKTLTERIKDNLASGTLEGDGLKEYLRDVNVLAKEMTNLERALRKVGVTDIKIDDSELKYLQGEITFIEKQMSDLKKGFTLDTTGILSSDKNLKQISESINKAIKNGESLQVTLNNLSQIKQQDITTQTGKISELEQTKQDAEQAIPKLEELLKKHRELEAFLQSSDKRKGDRERFNSLMGGAKETLGSEFTSKRQFEDKRMVVAQEILRLEQEIAATKSKGEKADKEIGTQNKVLKDLREYQAVLQQIQAQNQGGIGNFDQEMAELQTDFADVTLQARALGDAIAQALIKQLKDAGVELGQLSGRTKETTGAIDDFVVKTKKETQATDQATDSFKNKITQIFGLYNIYQLIRRGIQNAYNSIKQLDQAMNEIAVVTNMTTNELWGQIDAYMAVAKQYGVATQGVYEVSKLYYQQGRSSAEVTMLTAETLKMAKIAGIDYSKATDNMTVALNGFKMTASDASTVVDVYSKLAAVSAVDTEELAYAMSKTASIAESAGMSFQNTSVFLAQMIETTREAPENIGTAMKTIIARFQEMKKSPLELVEVEGEKVSYNRVDKALQSIGMTLQDTNGQFRDLDDVIYELADKWDGLDRNTQRYIATIVAGSRQQSRFLALMQDSDRLQELQQEAMNSEDAGLIQYYKTLDSVESKLNQLKTSFQQLYMSILDGPLIKGIIDFFTKIVTFFNRMPLESATLIITTAIVLLKKGLSLIGANIIRSFKSVSAATKATITNDVNYWIASWRKGAVQVQQAKRAAETGEDIGTGGFLGQASQTGKWSKVLGRIGAGFSYITLAISAVTLITELLSQFVESAKSAAQRIEEYQKRVEDARAKAATSKSEADNLETLGKKWTELNNSVEKNTTRRQEWLDVNKKIADEYPTLITSITDEGTAIIQLSDYYTSLLKVKREIAAQNAKDTLIAVNKKYEDPNLLFTTQLSEEKYKHNTTFTRELPYLENYQASSSQAYALKGDTPMSQSELIDKWEKQVALNRPSMNWFPSFYNQLENRNMETITAQDAILQLQSTYLQELSEKQAVNPNFDPTEFKKAYQEQLDMIRAVFGIEPQINIDGPYVNNWDSISNIPNKMQFDKDNPQLANRFRSYFEEIAAMSLASGLDKEGFIDSIGSGGFGSLMYNALSDELQQSGDWDKVVEGVNTKEEVEANNKRMLEFIRSGDFKEDKYRGKGKLDDAQVAELDKLSGMLQLMYHGYDQVFITSREAGQRYLEAEIALQLDANETRLTVAQKAILHSARGQYGAQKMKAEGKVTPEAVTEIVGELKESDDKLISFLTNTKNQELVEKLYRFTNDAAAFSANEREALAEEIKNTPELQDTKILSLFNSGADIDAQRQEVAEQINSTFITPIISDETLKGLNDYELTRLTNIQTALAKLSNDKETGSFTPDVKIEAVTQDTIELLGLIMARADLTEEQQQKIQEIDPSTFFGMQELLTFAQSLGSMGEEWNRLISMIQLAMEKRRVTEGDVQLAFDTYISTAEQAFEMASKTHTVQELIDLYRDGKIQLSDIDFNTGKIKNTKDFLTTQLAEAKANFEKAQEEGNSADEELYNRAYLYYEQQIQAIDELADSRTFLNDFISGYDFKTENLALSIENYNIVKQAGFGEGFNYNEVTNKWEKTVTDISGFYQAVTGVLIETGWNAGLVGGIFANLTKIIGENEEKEAADAISAAEKLINQFDVKTGKMTLSDVQLGKMDASTKALFEDTGFDTNESTRALTEAEYKQIVKQILINDGLSGEDLDRELNLRMAERLENIQADTERARDDIKNIAQSFDMDTGTFTIDTEQYNKLTSIWQNLFSLTDIDTYTSRAFDPSNLEDRERIGWYYDAFASAEQKSMEGYTQGRDQFIDRWIKQYEEDEEAKVKEALDKMAQVFDNIDLTSGTISIDTDEFKLMDGKGFNLKRIGANAWEYTFTSLEEIQQYLEQRFAGKTDSDEYKAELATLTAEFNENQIALAKENLNNVFDSIDLEGKKITLDKDLYTQLGDSLAGIIEQTGVDEWMIDIANPEAFEQYLKAAASIIDINSADGQAELNALTRLVQDYQKQYKQSIIDMITSMLSSSAEVLSEARSGGFSDKLKADILASSMGDGYTTIERANGTFGINSKATGAEVNLERVASDFFDAMGANLYLQEQYTRDSYDNLTDLIGLEEQAAQISEKKLRSEISAGEALMSMTRVAQAMVQTRMSSESYNFMSNSTTNKNLDPMYTLMDNIKQATDALETSAKDENGTIELKKLNAMLDYAGREQFAELSAISDDLTPPLTTSLEKGSIDELKKAIIARGQADIKAYNDNANKFNTWLDNQQALMDTSTIKLGEDGLKYLNTPYETLNELLPILEKTQTPEVISKVLQDTFQLMELTPDLEFGTAFSSVLAASGLTEPLINPLTTVANNIETGNSYLAIIAQLLGAPLKIEDKPGEGNIEDPTNGTASKVDEAGQAIEGAGDAGKKVTTSFTTIPEAVVSLVDTFGSATTAAQGFADKVNSLEIKIPTPSSSDTNSTTQTSEYYGGRASGGPVAKSGKTLVGEFGPEIVFQDGKSYIVGKNGPEFRDLPANSFVINHRDTSKILKKDSKKLGVPDGLSKGLGDYKITPIDDRAWNTAISDAAKGTDKTNDSSKETPSDGEFDRWYNFIRLIEDVEQAIAELQAERENLYGTDYTSSMMKEITLLQKQIAVVEEYKDAQVEYLKNFEKTEVKKYSKYLKIVNGVLQIDWVKLNKLSSEDAAPIKAVIEEWESLTDSISNSTKEIENFKAEIKALEDEMRDFYLDIEDQIIEALKARQQRVIDNLQEELDMRRKVDEQYLSSLRDNLDKERKMRDQAKAVEDRAQLERKVALLSRDTSGKSDLALAEAQRELQASNEGAYDTKREDFVAAEEEAARLAQERLQASIDLQTDILDFMNDNIQSFQASIDAWIAAEPTTLANFLNSWNTAYTNATPTAQAKHNEKLEDGIGKMKGYLQYLAKKEGLVEKPKAAKKPVVPKTTTAKTTTNNSTSKQKRYKVTYELWTKPDPSGLEPQAKMGSGYGVGKTKSVALSSAQYHANKKIGTKFWEARYSSAKAYKQGGLIDSTGLFMGHGSKTKPEGVLTADETKMWQNFMARMMKTDDLSHLTDAIQTINNGGNRIGQQFGNVTVVVQAAQDPKKTSEYVMEEFAKVARRAGSTTLP